MTKHVRELLRSTYTISRHNKYTGNILTSTSEEHCKIARATPGYVPYEQDTILRDTTHHRTTINKKETCDNIEAQKKLYTTLPQQRNFG